MAKPFGKRIQNWLRSNDTKEYLSAIAKARKSALADLLTVVRGGTPGENGTWARDSNIVMEFARWLSPDYSIKVNDLMIKLLTGELRVFRPADFETGVLPSLVHVRTLFEDDYFYPYVELLRACGLSTTSGSVRRRTRKNPQEFVRSDGDCMVSERYGKAIYFNSLAAKLNAETRERRLDCELRQAIIGNGARS